MQYNYHNIIMTEEDEIDVLGDFDLDNIDTANNIYDDTTLVSQNSDLFNCDYTIHPQWLLDKPSTNPDNWYDNNHSPSVIGTGQSESCNSNNEMLRHISTEDSITDESGWTEKEKNLLERGIEIFGKSNIRLSQFVGTKTASEVKYYLKNFYVENPASFLKATSEGSNAVNLVSDILNEKEIPASIEEIIAAVKTADSPTKKANNDSISTVHTSPAKKILKMPQKRVGKLVRKPNSVKMGNIQQVKSGYKTRLNANVGKLNKKPQSDVELVKTVVLVTGKGRSVPICDGEQVIKIQKSEEDSDLDIDVDDTINIETKPNINANTKDTEYVKPTVDSKDDTPLISNPEVLRELQSMETPQKEVVLDSNTATELEKVMHSDFFEGRSASTPDRYLKIRNHIINIWRMNKPNYVRKLTTRQGLKNCGNVNYVSRIHNFLEQIGAINFGCSEIVYERPLENLLQNYSAQAKEKAQRAQPNVGSQREFSELGPRPRFKKKKFANDGEGGCTLTHDQKGVVINTTIVNEEPVVKPRMYIKKPIVKLIYCRPFTEEYPQPYSLTIYLSTLLLMDFHAHMCLTEVMGLVGGHWIAYNNSLTISHYEPCKNIASSLTHCDMCPISQARAADSIHNRHLDILGWYHSHPTFAPEPSQQDLDTQLLVQQWIGRNGNPCIGVILSPFSSNGALIASPYRCMMVNKKTNFEDQYAPYKLSVYVNADHFVLQDFLNDLKRILSETNRDNLVEDKDKVGFGSPYFQDSSISHIEKYLTSARMHLAKCGNFNQNSRESILKNIENVVLNNCSL